MAKAAVRRKAAYGMASGALLLGGFGSPGSALGTPLPLRSAVIKASGSIRAVAKPETSMALPSADPATTVNALWIENNGGELLDPLTAGTWNFNWWIDANNPGAVDCTAVIHGLADVYWCSSLD